MIYTPLAARDHWVTIRERSRWLNQGLTEGNPVGRPLTSMQDVILMRTLRDHSTLRPRDLDWLARLEAS